MENRRSAWGLKESQCHANLQKGKEGGARELQASQPHLHPWEEDGAAHSGCHLKASGGKEGYHRITEW